MLDLNDISTREIVKKYLQEHKSMWEWIAQNVKKAVNVSEVADLKSIYLADKGLEIELEPFNCFMCKIDNEYGAGDCSLCNHITNCKKSCRGDSCLDGLYFKFITERNPQEALKIAHICDDFYYYILCKERIMKNIITTYYVKKG